MSFIMSKLFSAHDGDMLVGVLNKKDIQKSIRSAFKKRKNVCDTIFDEWGRIFENDCNELFVHRYNNPYFDNFMVCIFTHFRLFVVCNA